MPFLGQPRVEGREERLLVRSQQSLHGRFRAAEAVGKCLRFLVLSQEGQQGLSIGHRGGLHVLPEEMG